MEARAKKLIEALSLDIDLLGDGETYVLRQTDGPRKGLMFAEGSMKFVCEQAAAAYDRLAEQAQKGWDVEEALAGNKAVESYRSILFKQHAAELRAMTPKEPTLLERAVNGRTWAIDRDNKGNETCLLFEYRDGVCYVIREFHACDYLKRQGKE